jgi:hypothetical protein
MTDSNLTIGTTYYYGTYVVDGRDAYTRSSNVLYAAAAPAPGAGFSDPMEDLSLWNVTGSWGVEAGCASDSPGGPYANGLNSANNGLRTAVSLAGTDLPVLRFRDRFTLAAGDYGYLEVSPDGGGWTRLYCAQGGQAGWAEHEVSLLQWKGQANLRIRFYLVTDGSGTEEGWSLDDVRIENLTAEAMVVPFLEGFESGMARWVESNDWEVVTNEVWSGVKKVHSSGPLFGPDTTHRLTLAGKFNLASTTAPTLSFWYRGAFSWYVWFGVEISTDGGVGWATLWAIDSYSFASMPNWTKVSVSLSPYRSAPDVRIRFRADSGGNPPMDLSLDAIGIGDGAPGAPAPDLPEDGGSVDVLRPALQVVNASDGENDSLTYRFEVYSDVGLTNMVAQVPAVAEASIVTTWNVDLDLQDFSQYWWRCRANDGVHTGPWSEASMFYVNLMNSPPTAPAVVAPALDSILEALSESLVWNPSADMNAGDYVVGYQVQVDNSPAFDSPEIDDAGVGVPGPAPSTNWVVAIPLQATAGSDALQFGERYYWRVRGVDTRGAWSAWSAQAAWFYLGVPVPNISGLRMAEGVMSLNIAPSPRPFYIEFCTNLMEHSWERLPNTYSGTNVIFAIPTDRPSGFFRTVTE